MPRASKNIGIVAAVLGPTNTGKTYYAIERMLGHRSGIIGLPLRLLAREVYERIVTLRGPSVVALITGEERIIPPRAQYWVCTVEAMPTGTGTDFVAIDEIQMCADPQRGHIFTHRLLHARGTHETLFLGAENMRQAIANLVPGVTFLKRERFSALRYVGSKKVSRMPPRSAIVSFSVDNVYAMAELIRRQKGGCAIVMGALSPRTRNAQVDLYQNGDVDYLVATDAIGMGLNLDMRHIAFSALEKFDGQRMRPLLPQELAQIAGRAGRYTQDGTFGVTGDAPPLSDEVISAIEEHRFEPVRKISWRNAELDFGTPERLIASLEAPSPNPWLIRAPDADDLIALKSLLCFPEVQDRLTGPKRLSLLWEVCGIPDFRGISSHEHATLLARIYEFLVGRGLGGGRIPNDWLAKAIARIDRTDGDIDTLSKRLSYIRTWTYISQRKGWVDDENHWRDETHAVEDRLSDALHQRLTQRFIDRRTSVLLRRLKQKETLVAEVKDTGEVTIDGEFVGKIEGFRFWQDKGDSSDENKIVRQAALQALKPEFHLRADRFYNASDTEMEFTEQGGLLWGTTAIGKLVKGDDILRPSVQAFVDTEAGEDITLKVQRRLQHFIDRKIAALFEPLLKLEKDEELQGLARGFAFQMAKALGILSREAVAKDVKALDQDARASLRKHGLRFGQFTIFMPALLKPAPTRLRLVLHSLWEGLSEFPESPPPGLVTIPNLTDLPKAHYTLSGYRPAGSRAIRIDMLERLADILRQKDAKAGFEATTDMLSITGMTLEQFVDLMQGLGYHGEQGTRDKVKTAAEPVVLAPPPPEDQENLPQNPIPEEVSLLAPAEPPADTPADPDPAPASAENDPPATPEADHAEASEQEVFYTFKWVPKPHHNRPARAHNSQTAKGAPPARHTSEEKPPQQNRGPGRSRPGQNEGGDTKNKRGEHKNGGTPNTHKPRHGASQNRYSKGKPTKIDPDNPFAALLALKDKL